MARSRSDRTPSTGERIYSVLLLLCPRAFRVEYGEAMRQLIRDRLRNEQPAEASRRAMFWTGVFTDLVRTAMLERLEHTMTATNLARYGGLLAIIGGLLWTSGMTTVAARTQDIGDVALVLLIAAVAITGVLVAITAQHAVATAKLAVAGAAFGSLGVLFLLAGLLTDAWWLIGGSVYWLLFGSCLTGLGMLTLQRVPRWSAVALVAASVIMIPLNEDNWQAWLAVPFGVAWIAVGYALWTRATDRMMLAP